MSGETTTTTRGTPFNFKPMTYRESFARWWKTPSLEAAEYAVLSTLPFFPNPKNNRSATVQQVDIGKDLFLNELCIKNESAGSDADEYCKDIVVLHGYGAGLGLFIKNFEAWSSLPGSRLFALDLLGFGRSARPSFKIKTQDVGFQSEPGVFPAVQETCDWFLESLEQWRKTRGLDRFVLMAHSMGGYLAYEYATKYPQHVAKLVMISPAGVERGYKPELEHKSIFAPKKDTKKDAKKDSASASASAMASSASSQVSLSTSGSRDKGKDSANEAARADAQADPDAFGSVLSDEPDPLIDDLATTSRDLPHMLVYLWNSHISPFQIVRHSAFLGPKLISKWTYRRFGDMEPEQQQAMHNYVYRIWTASSSGEHAITRLLAPGAVARMPVIERISQLQCPSLWFYGENDWMNSYAGRECVKRLQARGLPAWWAVLEKAGHHTYLDNPEKTDPLVLAFIREDEDELKSITSRELLASSAKY